MSSGTFSTRWSHTHLKLQPILVVLAYVLISLAALIYALSLSRHSCLLQNEWCGQDVDQYIDYSNSMLSGHGFAAKAVATMYNIDIKLHPEYVPDVLRLPSYSVLLTLGRFIYNQPPLALIYNYLFFGLILMYSALSIRSFLSPWLGVMVFLSIAFNSSLLFYTAWFGGVDVMVTACLMGTFYHSLCLFKTQRPVIHTVIASLFSLLTVLSRQNTLIFILPFLTFAILIGYTHHLKLKRLSYFGVVLGLTLAGLVGWGVRNYTILGKFSLSEASGQQMFAEYVYFTPYPTTESQELSLWFFSNQGGMKFMTQQMDQGQTIPKAYATLNSHLTQITYQYLFDHPQTFKQHYLKSVEVFYTIVPYTWDKTDLLGWIKSVQPMFNLFLLYVSLVFPILYFFKPSKHFLLTISIWISVMLFSLISSFFHGIVIGNRGFLPVQPLTSILVGLFCESLIIKIVSLFRTSIIQ